MSFSCDPIVDCVLQIVYVRVFFSISMSDTKNNQLFFNYSQFYISFFDNWQKLFHCVRLEFVIF